MATTTAALICPQGHGPGAPGSRFCTMCGTQLVTPPAPGQAGQASPALAQAATAGGWQPVNTGPGQAMAAGQWQPVAAVPGQPIAAPAAAQPVPAVSDPAAAQAAAIPAASPVQGQQPVCKVCGGTGAGLSDADVICLECGWLRPLLPGYKLDRSVFLWAQDGQAMTNLQKIPTLHTAVKAVSDRVGRPWIESTFNGIRLGPKQFPDVWVRAVLAARLLGLPNMPDVYISGDQMWNTYTFGTENSSFIVLGTAILNNFQNDELLFVLAREMGHCRAGHALWKTVTRFLTGDLTVQHGVLSQGVLNAISLSPTKWIHDAVDLPLMAWSRQSDITADRAGLLAIGDEGLARRVLLAWSIRSARLLKQVNIDEWLKQEDASGDQMTRFTEMTTSSSMYTTRRLRLLGQAAREPELMRWSQAIQPIRKKLTPPPQAPISGVTSAARPGAPPAARPAAPAPAPAPGAAQADSIRVLCNKCQTAMRIPLAILRGKTSLNVRCPKCQNVFTLRPKPAAQAAAPGGAGTKPVAPPSTGTGTKPSAAATPAGAATAKSVAAPSVAGVGEKPVAPAPAPAAAKTKPTAAPTPASAKAKSPARPQAAAAPQKQAR